MKREEEFVGQRSQKEGRRSLARQRKERSSEKKGMERKR